MSRVLRLGARGIPEVLMDMVQKPEIDESIRAEYVFYRSSCTSGPSDDRC